MQNTLIAIFSCTFTGTPDTKMLELRCGVLKQTVADFSQEVV